MTERATEPKLLIPFLSKKLLLWLARRPNPHPLVNTRETHAELLGSVMLGFVIGSVISFLLIPVIFWPPRRSRFSASTNPPQSIYDALGHPAWIGWVFVGVVLVSILISCLRTRVIFSTSGEDDLNG